MTTTQAVRVVEELDALEDQIRCGDVERAAWGLHTVLNERKRAMSPEAWQEAVRTIVRTHPVLELIHHSPFSRRAFEKPRGYAGDAETLDLVYGTLPVPPDTTVIGRRVVACELDACTSRGIRARRDLLADAIDQIAADRPCPRVLSVACGHLREAQRSSAQARGRLSALIAFDQDGESLDRVSREQPFVTTVRGTVRQIVSGKLRWTGIDLVYAAGLYDYLSERFAAELTTRLFAMLAPRGRLILANMTPESTDHGYLEACMDWWMTYRDESAMNRLIAAIPPREFRWARTFRDSTGHVVLLELERA